MKKSIVSVVIAFFLLSGILPAYALVPNDLEYSRQQAMWNSVNVPAAWDITTGSKQTVVAVIDTGVDTWHPDLAGNIWFNQFEIDGNGTDDDNNGYIDDIHGWNFIEKNNDVRTSVFNSADMPEAVRHGTVAAGLIGAVGNNLLAGTGVNWNVSIMPLRAVGSDGYGSMSDVVEAIRYAVSNGADVISMSMVSGSADEGLRQALRAAYEQGVVLVASAGNRHANLGKSPNYPICYDMNDAEDWIIGVGALSSSTPDKMAYFSDYGSCVDFMAPGVGVNSTERYAPQFGYNDAFGGPWDGTSFSAPIVAGAVALLKSIHPEWAPAKIISILKETADNIDKANPNFISKLGAGRVNIGKSVARAAMETSFRGVDLSRLFFVYDKNKLARFDINNNANYILASFQDAQVVDLARMGNRPGGREYLAALLKRDKYFYIRFFDENGRRLKEIGLSGATNDNALATKVVWRGENLTVGYIDSKTKVSYLVDYDLNGKNLRELKVKNLVDWESEQRTGSLVVVSPVRSSFKWQLYDNLNNQISSDVWKGYNSIDDLRLGYFWGEQNLQIATVLKNKKTTEWKMVDSGSKKTTTQPLPQKNTSYTILPGLYSSRSAFFVYAPGNSDYQVYNGRAQLLMGGKF